MNAIEITKTSDIHLVQRDRPECGPNDLIIQTLGCGICGTDLLKINLKLLNETKVLGHEICGTVIETGASVTKFKTGDRIVVAHHVPCFDCHDCRHGCYSMCQKFKATNLDPGGFAEFVRVSADHIEHTAFKIPDQTPWQEAIFTEPLACCVRNVDRLNLIANDVVVIVGLGSIGLMMTVLLKNMGCSVIGVDLDQSRCDFAKTYGIDQTFCPNQSGDHAIALAQVKKYLQEVSDNRGADGLIFTAGPAKMVNECLSWVRSGGAVNLFAHLSGESATLDLAELYHRELQIVTTYSPSPEALKKSFVLLTENDLGLRHMFSSYGVKDFEKAVNDCNSRRVHKALIAFQDESNY